MSGLAIFLCAIQLTGVTGSGLRARAYFDANNVRLGDQLSLTIDFRGEADFWSLHSPDLSRIVSKADWKLYDMNAKTKTSSDSRSLTYLIRPNREGLLWFPALEFEYVGKDGSPCRVRANEIPVHVRGCAQPDGAKLPEEMFADEDKMPSPPDLVQTVSRALSDDESFRWRRALSQATNADVFVEFDFPEARMNEATCAIREGNWARAMKIYQKLEWRTGQTEGIEKGIRAALALKHDNPAVELPVWRQVLRPLLKFDWRGRVGLVVGGFALLALVFWLLGRGVRAVACVALALLCLLPASAETVETVVTNADGSVVHSRVVSGSNGGVSFSFSSTSSSGGTGLPARNALGGGLFEMMEDFDPFGMMGRRRRQRLPVTIDVNLASDRQPVVVGEDFNLVLSVEIPRYVSFSDRIRLAIAEQEQLTQVGNGYALRNVAARNPTNVIQRLVFPMRANVPIKGPLHFSVEGEYVFSGENSFFATARPYSSGPRVAPFVVKPLPEEGKPADFAGVISEELNLQERCDLLSVGTNDVVTITYRMSPRGFVPADFLLPGAAFEWERRKDGSGRLSEIEYRRFFVADGAKTTPRIRVSYYDPRTKSYKTAEAGGTPLSYRPEE